MLIRLSEHSDWEIGSTRTADIEFARGVLLNLRWVVPDGDSAQKGDPVLRLSGKIPVLAPCHHWEDGIFKSCIRFLLRHNSSLFARLAGFKYSKNRQVVHDLVHGILERLEFDERGICIQNPDLWSAEATATVVAPSAGILTHYRIDAHPMWYSGASGSSELLIYVVPSGECANSLDDVVGGIIESGTIQGQWWKLYILYDTSYLMSDRPSDDVFSIGSIPEVERDYPLTPIHVLAAEVKQEIFGNLNSTARTTSARRARLVCSRIIAASSYIDVQLSDSPPYEVIDSLLGPDSTTDRKLISWAITQAISPKTLVYVATRDGGILSEICRLHRERNLRVFCSHLDGAFAKLLESSREECLQDRLEYLKSRPISTS